MLKGHGFYLQTFQNEAFALFIDKFLNGRCGVAKGCALSNTTSSATISAGYFVIRGRFLEVVSSETVSSISTDGYYSLVCEVDLTQTNTENVFNQASIKTVYNASAYPTLTQQDLTNGGTLYQYEFARFRVLSGAITEFTDKRTYVDFETIFDAIETTSNSLIAEIQEALADVLDGSSYLLKTGGTISGDLEVSGNISSDDITDISRKCLFE